MSSIVTDKRLIGRVIADLAAAGVYPSPDAVAELLGREVSESVFYQTRKRMEDESLIDLSKIDRPRPKRKAAEPMPEPPTPEEIGARADEIRKEQVAETRKRASRKGEFKQDHSVHGRANRRAGPQPKAQEGLWTPPWARHWPDSTRDTFSTVIDAVRAYRAVERRCNFGLRNLRKLTNYQDAKS